MLVALTPCCHNETVSVKGIHHLSTALRQLVQNFVEKGLVNAFMLSYTFHERAISPPSPDCGVGYFMLMSCFLDHTQEGYDVSCC